MQQIIQYNYPAIRVVIQILKETQTQTKSILQSVNNEGKIE